MFTVRETKLLLKICEKVKMKSPDNSLISSIMNKLENVHKLKNNKFERIVINILFRVISDKDAKIKELEDENKNLKK